MLEQMIKSNRRQPASPLSLKNSSNTARILFKLIFFINFEPNYVKASLEIRTKNSQQFSFSLKNLSKTAKNPILFLFKNLFSYLYLAKNIGKKIHKKCNTVAHEIISLRSYIFFFFHDKMFCLYNENLLMFDRPSARCILVCDKH